MTAAFDGTTTICANGSAHSVEGHIKAQAETGRPIRYFRDNMPRGTGGCIKASVGAEQNRTMLVTGGAVWLEDDPRWMVAQHRAMGNALTVFCTEDPDAMTIDGHRALTPTGVYCVEPSVLPHIRDVGFQDLKEQVIPALKEGGLRVGAVVLRKPVIEITDCRDYLRAVSRALATGAEMLVGYRELAPGIWCGEDVTIAADARILGPAVIGHGSQLESQSVVIGPAIIGHDCRVGVRAWAIRAVVPNQTQLFAERRYTDTFVTGTGVLSSHATGSVNRGRRGAPGHDSAGALSYGTVNWKSRLTDNWLPAGAVCGAFIWAFWGSLSRLWAIWQSDGDYSAGQLVPLAAFYMMTARRGGRRGDRQLQCWSAGLLVFLLGVALHLVGTGYRYHSMENTGMVLSGVGIIMSIVGRQKAQRLWYPLLFMFFMLPLPHRLHEAALVPLQNLSADASRIVLGMIHIPATQHGHVLEVAGHGLSVAAACSGLRMAIAFFIVTAFLVYLVNRPHWQKVAVLASAIPIALICNVARIVGLACLYHFGYGTYARGAFHDGAGIIMMPMALLIVLFEFWILKNLSVPSDRGTVFGNRAHAVS